VSRSEQRGPYLLRKLNASRMTQSTTDPLRLAMCPSCGTTDETTTYGALRAGGSSWLCVRCGQRWTLARLATAAAYAEWVAGGAVLTPAVRQTFDRTGDDRKSEEETVVS
jgi:hypothetical protein